MMLSGESFTLAERWPWLSAHALPAGPVVMWLALALLGLAPAGMACLPVLLLGCGFFYAPVVLAGLADFGLIPPIELFGYVAIGLREHLTGARIVRDAASLVGSLLALRLRSNIPAARRLPVPCALDALLNAEPSPAAAGGPREWSPGDLLPTWRACSGVTERAGLTQLRAHLERFAGLPPKWREMVCSALSRWPVLFAERAWMFTPAEDLLVQYTVGASSGRPESMHLAFYPKGAPAFFPPASFLATWSASAPRVSSVGWSDVNTTLANFDQGDRLLQLVVACDWLMLAPSSAAATPAPSGAAQAPGATPSPSGAAQAPGATWRQLLSLFPEAFVPRKPAAADPAAFLSDPSTRRRAARLLRRRRPDAPLPPDRGAAAEHTHEAGTGAGRAEDGKAAPPGTGAGAAAGPASGGASAPTAEATSASPSARPVLLLTLADGSELLLPVSLDATPQSGRA
jgi:hypothetical protein